MSTILTGLISHSLNLTESLKQLGRDMETRRERERERGRERGRERERWRERERGREEALSCVTTAALVLEAPVSL